MSDIQPEALPTYTLVVWTTVGGGGVACHVVAGFSSLEKAEAAAQQIDQASPYTSKYVVVEVS
jgi:hypothetical protein